MDFERDPIKRRLTYREIEVAWYDEPKDGIYIAIPMPILSHMPITTSDCAEKALREFAQNCRANPEVMRRLNHLTRTGKE